MIELSALRSRFGKRLTALFVVLALVPIFTLALITDLSVSRELVALSEERRANQARSQTRAILERLALLEAELALLATSTATGPTPTIPEALRQTIAQRFERLTWRGSRSERTLLGGAVQPPSLSIEQRLRLAGDRTLLIVDHRNAEPRLLLARAVSAGEVKEPGELWGEVDSDYLWWGVDREPQLAEMTELCILEPTHRRVLACSSDDPAVRGEDLRADITGESEGTLSWSRGSDSYRAHYRTAGLRDVYGHPGFTVLLSEAEAGLGGPLRDFRLSFVPIVLATLGLVVLLSIRQIRRSLTSLEQLRVGTREIAAGNFSAQIEVASRDEFRELARSFNLMAERLGAHFSALNSLTEIQSAVLSADGRRQVAYAVLSRLERLLPCGSSQLTVLHAAEPHATTFKLRPDGSEEVVEELLHVEDLWWIQEIDELQVIAADERLPSFLASLRWGPVGEVAIVPVVLESKAIGVLAAGLDEGRSVDAEELGPVRQLGGQIAQAFAKAALIEQLEELSHGTLSALARTIDANSEWTRGHSERVAALAVRLGRKMRLSTSDLHTLERGALLHDIGKLGVPSSILDSPSRLTDDERETVQKHVEIGASILEPVPSLADTLPVVRQHHEWYDGSGYPEGLAGEEIHPLARVLAVVDCYDALRSARPYRGAVADHVVQVHLRAQAGSQFAPEVVEAFLDLLRESRGEPNDLEQPPQALVG